MRSKPTSETPFHLAVGSEVVILAEVGLVSYRIADHDEGNNEKGIRLHLDLLDEVGQRLNNGWLTTRSLWPSTTILRLSLGTLTSGTSS